MPKGADQITLLIVRGSIASLPAEQQQKVAVIADQIRDLVLKNGDEGALALALVGAEEAAKD